jgi:hypothetical protein
MNNASLHLQPCARVLFGALISLLLVVGPVRILAEPPSRKIAPGYSTTKLLSGVPYDLAGKRIVFTNCYTTIPNAPDQHLMFPAVWNASIDDTTRIVMASSHDGRNWYWVPGGDLLETAEYGRWDGGCIWAQPNLIELPNGDWALPYSAQNVPQPFR